MKKILTFAALLVISGIGLHSRPLMSAEQNFDVSKAIAAGDHQGLADYYKAEADRYRKKAADHEAMMADYKSTHAYKKGMENSFQAHCTKLKADALDMAEKYDALAKQEQDLVKKK